MDKKGTSDDFTDQEMIDWLRQEEDLRVCLAQDIRMCRVKPSPRELFAAEHMERLLARIAALEAALETFVLTPTFQLTNGVTTTTAIVVFDDDLKKAADILGINIDLRAARAAMEGK